MAASSQISIQKRLTAFLQVASYVSRTAIADFYTHYPLIPNHSQGVNSLDRHGVMWLAQQVIATEQAMIVPDLGHLRECANLKEQGPVALPQKLRFYAGFPVKIQDQIQGTLAVMAREPHHLSQAQRTILGILAEEMGHCLTLEIQSPQFEVRPVSLSSPLGQQQPPPLPINITEYRAVLKLSMALQECLSFEDLTNQLIAVLPVDLPIARLTVIRFCKNHPPQQLLDWTAEAIPPPVEPANCYVAEEFEDCILTRQRFVDLLHCQPSRSPDCQRGCYPLKVNTQVVGALKVQLLPTEGKQIPLSSPVFTSIAHQISVTVHRLQLFESLRSESLQDPLTKLFNRRYMITLLDKLLTRVGYGRYQVGLIMLDIDYFKRVNDTYGHDAGDHVLRVLGLFLKGHARPNDAVCRYGGEEFALVLPDVTYEVIARRANQLCRSIKYLSLKVGDTSLQVTLSAGFAIAPIHGKTPATLIKAADEALYAAKRGGRDRAIGAALPNGHPKREG